MERLLERLKCDERRGSKPRCHWLTHGAPEQVAGRLNALTEPWGSVSEGDYWMPEGFRETEEAQLDKAERVLPKQDRDRLHSWWLAVSRGNTRTPNWDIVSTCTVDGVKGLLLVEAKAHSKELSEKDRSKAGESNLPRIANCIREANAGLASRTGLTWALSHEHRYQMSNRFAWSWKLTELGYPVILVYLGFLGAEEIAVQEYSNRFLSPAVAEWESLVKAHSEPLFPPDVWDSQWSVNGQTFVPRIHSMETPYDGPVEGD